MKTSFYFVIWILIYPILDLLNNSVINNNTFIFAFIIVIGISWLLNRAMPKTLVYEEATKTLPILEDVYTGNVLSFKKRLAREAKIETFTSLYLIVSTVVIAFAIFQFGESDWIALIVFGMFSFKAISRSISLIGANSRLKSNPPAEQCMEIADDTYDLDYASYYEAHNGITYQEMLPPKPKFFKAFRVFSTVIAVMATLLGCVFIISGIVIMLTDRSLVFAAVAGMNFLYGSLATYFGVKDIVSIILKP